MTPGCNIPEGFQADAALHIDPTIESMSAGFTTLLSFSDEDLTRMGERGLALVKEKFTWQRVASCVHTLSRWVVYGGQMPLLFIEIVVEFLIALDRVPVRVALNSGRGA